MLQIGGGGSVVVELPLIPRKNCRIIFNTKFAVYTEDMDLLTPLRNPSRGVYRSSYHATLYNCGPALHFLVLPFVAIHLAAVALVDPGVNIWNHCSI